MKFTAPNDCPIARFSAATETVIDQTATSVGLPGAQGSITEFLADTEETTDDGESGSEPVFSYGTTDLYRTAHDGDIGCPCECLGQFGCPVHRYVAENGDLTLVFHAKDFEQLQSVTAEFRDRYSDIDVQQLLQPPLEGTPEERVFVNRGKLTDRQLEVVQTAYDRGYFERPKQANATEIATELGISQSTFTEHLVTAQRKLLGDVLEDRS